MHAQATPPATAEPALKPAPRLLDHSPGGWQRLVDLCWFWGQVVRTAPSLSLGWGTLVILRGLLVPVQLLLTKRLVDVLAASLTGGFTPGIFLWVSLLVGALLTERALDGVSPYLKALSEQRIGPRLQERVMAHGSVVDLAAFEHEAYHDRLHRVMSEGERRGPQLLEQ